MDCRSCCSSLELVMADLGTAPFSNAYLTTAQLSEPELWHPLRVLVCTSCWLVQTEDFARRDELFSHDYAYFSSFSDSWLAHSRNYAERMIRELELNESSFVVEIASNDGYLLKEFVTESIPCLGVEPTASTAAASRAIGVSVLQEFFGEETARQVLTEHGPADLIVANNVLAHVPDINDFVRGFSTLLSINGVATFEFPHLLRLIQGMQFDTIYHEHYSYLSLTAVHKIFSKNGLAVVDVEEIPTHGGSIRVFAKRLETNPYENDSVSRLLQLEHEVGITTASYYETFQRNCIEIKHDLIEHLLQAQRDGLKVAAYGAAAKGNTLLNYAGIKTDLVKFVVDRSPAKQGKFLPGSRIPIVDESWLRNEQPDLVLILPWNLSIELSSQLSYLNYWGGRAVTAVPSWEVVL